MRTMLLVLALVFIFAIAVSADEPGQLAPASSLTTLSSAPSRHFELSPPGITRQFRISDSARLDLRANDDVTFIVSGPIRLRTDQGPTDNTCYRIRTFQMKRIDNTDSTRPSGYTTCLSANRVQLKNASGGGK